MGKKFADGELNPLDVKLLSKNTGDEIWGFYAGRPKQSERRATYAM